MDFSATHVDMVIASYVVTAICLVGLVFFLVQRDRHLARKLKEHKSD